MTVQPYRKIPRVPLAGPVLAAALAVSSCKNKDDTTKPVDPGDAARRSAQSFVHCVEGGSAGCVRSGLDHSGWDAFFLLGWLAAGSPVAILEALPRELQAHSSPKVIQGRFVQGVERLSMDLRGAECDPAGAQELGPLIDQVSSAATSRLKQLGMWSPDMSEVVTGLTAEAKEGVGDGYLVRMSCKRDPYQVYLGTARDDIRHDVVGIMASLPTFLGGEPVDPSRVQDRLASRSLGLATSAGTIAPGTVHPWVPVRLEDF